MAHRIAADTIRDQNPLLSFGRYGRPASPEEFAPYFWMRDSRDAKVRLLWDRMLVSTRPDPSDAGMAWFLGPATRNAMPQNSSACSTNIRLRLF